MSLCHLHQAVRQAAQHAGYMGVRSVAVRAIPSLLQRLESSRLLLDAPASAWLHTSTAAPDAAQKVQPRADATDASGAGASAGSATAGGGDPQAQERRTEGPESASSTTGSGDASGSESGKSASGSSGSGNASSGWNPAGWQRQLRGAFEGMSGKIRSGEAQSLVTARARELAAAVAHDLHEAVRPAHSSTGVTRKYEGPVAEPHAEGSGALLVSKQPERGWQKAWRELNEKFGGHPLFQRLRSVRGAAAVQRGKELADDLRDRWESSDHPMVHHVEDVKERLFSESVAAQALREIRMRDPSFSMPEFMRSLKGDAPVVVKAFLTHDLQTLSQHCGPELLERFTGIFKHFQAEGTFDDPTILFVSDVELVELQVEKGDPLMVVQFHCQQLKCTRDKFGNVVDGSTDSIQRVFYFWGLQQERQGTLLPDGRLLPPRWVIQDMMWQSMLMLA